MQTGWMSVELARLNQDAATRPAATCGAEAGKPHATVDRVTGCGGNRPCDEASAPNIPSLRLPASVAMVFPLPVIVAVALASPLRAVPSDSVRADRDIRLAALRHVADVKRCYEREGLRRNPGLSGTLDVTVTVLATGVVSDASVASTDMPGAAAREVARCLTTAIRNWRFDRGPYAVETIVFPFRFTPVNAADRQFIATS